MQGSHIRYVLIGLALLLACRVSRAEHPNVLFIIADDLGYGDLACYGNPVIETPAIDSLAQTGVRLTHHYAPSPLCAPSRAGFLTGRFNHRTGAVDVSSNRGLDRIALSEKTFGDYFGSQGYRTALIGKWHNGLYCRDHLPHRRGFDQFIGFPNGGQDYWRWNLLRNDEPMPQDGRYLTDALNDEAIGFIEACDREDVPFALFLAHHAPHVPFQAPESLVKKYRDRLGKDVSPHVATIYAMIEAMDSGLARVFSTLKRLGVWEDTIIVFTSDNGAQLGKVGGQSTVRFHAGLSGNKGDVGEQGIRVPAILSWPGNVPAGQICDTPVHGCDWLPTLIGLTTLQLNSHDTARLDGRDLGPLFLGESSSRLESRPLCFQKNRYRPVAHSDAAIRSGRWKLVWPGVRETMRKDLARDNPSYLRGITQPHWEMPLDRELGPVPSVEAPAPKLFDLLEDPAERVDLANEFPGRVAALAGEYDHWFADVMRDWERSRDSILQHDRDYWKSKQAPDPRKLFEDYWQWNRVQGVRPGVDDPLSVFQGYWSQASEATGQPD